MWRTHIRKVAACLGAAALASRSLIGGTFAKYVTRSEGTAAARVANWGFADEGTIELDELFKANYDDTVVAEDGESLLIAPGTSGSDTFEFAYSGTNGTAAPEVAYTFSVSTEGSTIGDSVKANPDIQFKLDDGEFGTWDELLAAIRALSGSQEGTKEYAANTLPEAFADAENDQHTVSWRWLFEDSANLDAQDVMDTAMGNAAELENVMICISVSATQID